MIQSANASAYNLPDGKCIYRPAEPEGLGTRKGSRYSIHVLSPDEAAHASAFHEEWDRLARSSNNLYAFYQSPVWWDYSLQGRLRDYILRLHEGERPSLVKISDASGGLVGAVGISTSRCPLSFTLRSRELVRAHVRAIKILGGQPLVRDEEGLYVELVESLFSGFPDCDFIHLQFIPVGSSCWNFLCNSQDLRRHAKVCFPAEGVPHPRITLPPSFAEYLRKFKSKTRYNLQRQVRQLREYGSGRLELVRIEHAEDVSAFLDEAVKISAKSWQCKSLGLEMDHSPEECNRYQRFAVEGVLRCYLLRCGDTPCAFVRGFQYGDVFYYSRIGFDERFAAFSPGTVLLYLLLEDLFDHKPPTHVNLQEGFWDYKRLFATDYLEKRDALLLRKGAKISSRFLIDAHEAYRSSLRIVKRLIGRKGIPSRNERPQSQRS